MVFWKFAAAAGPGMEQLFEVCAFSMRRAVTMINWGVQSVANEKVFNVEHTHGNDQSKIPREETRFPNSETSFSASSNTNSWKPSYIGEVEGEQWLQTKWDTFDRRDRWTAPKRRTTVSQNILSKICVIKAKHANMLLNHQFQIERASQTYCVILDQIVKPISAVLLPNLCQNISQQ